MDLKGLSDSLSSRAQQSVCNWFVLDADADSMVDLQGLSEKLNKPFARGGRFPRAERFLPNLASRRRAASDEDAEGEGLQVLTKPDLEGRLLAMTRRLLTMPVKAAC